VIKVVCCETGEVIKPRALPEGLADMGAVRVLRAIVPHTLDEQIAFLRGAVNDA